jgi:predicted sulfurtransferase
MRRQSNFARVPLRALARPGVDDALIGVEAYRRRRGSGHIDTPPEDNATPVTVLTSPKLRAELGLKKRERRGRIFVHEPRDEDGALARLRNQIEFELPLSGVDYRIRGGLSERFAPTSLADADWDITTDSSAACFVRASAGCEHDERAVVFCDFAPPSAAATDAPIFADIDAAPSGVPAVYQLASVYRYATARVPLPFGGDAERYARFLELRLAKLGVLGRVHVAVEGVNAQLAVPRDRWTHFERFTRGDAFLGGGDAPARLNLDGEWRPQVPAVADARARVCGADAPAVHAPGDAEGAPFRKLHVRVRECIVADGGIDAREAPLELNDCGEECEPREWHAALRALNARGEGGTAAGAAAAAATTSSSPAVAETDEFSMSPAPIVIDVRNAYETSVGTFAGATPLDTENFRETWDKLRGALAECDPETQPLMLFCTGGIRCEKVAAFAKQRLGFKDVTRLAGGIVNYARTMREEIDGAEGPGAFERASAFRGINFVFDGRVGELITRDLFAGPGSVEGERGGERGGEGRGKKTHRLERTQRGGSNARFAALAATLRARCDLALDRSGGAIAGPDTEERYAAQRRVRECVGLVDRRRRQQQQQQQRQQQQQQQRRAVHSSSATAQAAPDSDAGSDGNDESDDRFWTSLASGFARDELALLAELRAETLARFASRAHMLSATTQGLLLARLCDFSGAKRVLEVGTFTGFGALCLAQAESVDHVVTVEQVRRSPPHCA